MSSNPKIIKKADKPIHPDVRRLAASMKAVLIRKYPDPLERQMVAQKIMREVKAT